MTKKLKPEYFEDIQEVSNLQAKIYEVIPEREYYHVIFAALSGVLNELVWEWAKSENKKRWTEK